MTPEFDRRSAIVLGSPYWDVDGGVDVEEYMRRREKRDTLVDAIQVADTYEDLDGENKELYDLAEKAADDAAKAEADEAAAREAKIKEIEDGVAAGDPAYEWAVEGYRRFTNYYDDPAAWAPTPGTPDKAGAAMATD